jgi:putative flippase GtrA
MADSATLHRWAQRFVGFLGVGAIATALQYLILLLGVEAFGASPVVASAVGFTVSAVANYLLNYRYTFRSERSHGSAALRFAIVATAGLLLTALMMEVLAHRAGLPYLWAQVLTTGVVLACNFVAHALWSFAKESA